MLTVTIDPAIFSPPSEASAESVRGYVSLLLHWKGVLDGGWARVLKCRSTPAILVKCNCYPFRPWLRDLFARTRTTDYDSNTVAILADTLLARSGDLEEATGIDDILASHLRFVPDVFAGHGPLELRSESEKCALVIAIIRTASTDPSAPGHGLALGSRVGSHEITVGAEIEVIDHHRTDLGALPAAPNRFEGRAAICDTFQSLVESLSDLAIWKCARANSDLETAIKVSIFESRVARGLPVSWDTLPRFTLQPGFFESLRACGATTNDSLARSTLRSIEDTVEDLRLAATHALRTGAGANTGQRSRGPDLAWRRDVTYDHHLHYWQRGDDGSKELSCVVTHNCFDITS